MKTKQQIQWDYVSTKEPVSSLYPDSCSAVSSVCVLYCQPAEEEENIPYLDTASTDSAQPRDGHTYTERRQKESMNDVHICVHTSIYTELQVHCTTHTEHNDVTCTCVHIHIHASTTY